MSRELFYQQQYLQKTGDWGQSDSCWKARIIHNIYQKNGLQPASVIDVGCGAGGVLQELLQLNDNLQHARGYDISPVAIKLAREKASPKLTFQRGNIPPGETADLLVMMDVVEHVEDYYGFMAGLKPHAHFFVFHIPLDLCCRTVVKPHVLLGHRQSVGHLHYWSEEMVWWLLTDCGYQVIDYHFTKPVIDTQRPHGIKQMVKKTLRNASFSLSPSWSSKLWGGYSLLILAKLTGNE